MHTYSIPCTQNSVVSFSIHHTQNTHNYTYSYYLSAVLFISETSHPSYQSRNICIYSEHMYNNIERIIHTSENERIKLCQFALEGVKKRIIGQRKHEFFEEYRGKIYSYIDSK